MKRERNMRISRFILLAVVALISTFAANAQNVRKNTAFIVKVKGSSNLHDWVMEAKSGTIEANLNLASNVSYLAGIQSLSFNLPVKNLKSEEGNLMNTRAYDALKAEKYPNISFKLLSATPTSNSANKSTFKVVGELTISGTTKQIEMTANATKNADGSVIITGTESLKMTQFGIKPPSYMFGALKVTDNLTIDYTVRL
ncbi:MAG TPA: YceI family protein [Flavisolibacter sp.]|nr:YceI family protein [Flavisolibacter sp.]